MADPHVLSISLLDDRGKYRAVNYYVASAATLAQVQTWLDAHINLLEACVGGKIASITLQFAMAITDPDTATPVIDCPTDQGALAGFTATGTGYKHSIYLPTFRKTLITAGEVVDAGAFAAWYADILAGGTGVVVTDKSARALSGFLSSKPVNRK